MVSLGSSISHDVKENEGTDRLYGQKEGDGSPKSGRPGPSLL